MTSSTSPPSATNRNQSPPSEITEARNSRRKSRFRRRRRGRRGRPSAARRLVRPCGCQTIWVPAEGPGKGGSRDARAASRGSGRRRSGGSTRSARSTSIPWGTPEDAPPADVIVITHAHQRPLLQPEDIERLSTPSTKLVAPHDVAKELTGDVTPVAPGESHEVGGLRFTTVPAYNTREERARRPPTGEPVGRLRRSSWGAARTTTPATRTTRRSSTTSRPTSRSCRSAATTR